MIFHHGKRTPTVLIPAFLLLFLSAAAAASGQTPPPPPPPTPASNPVPQNQTTADEDFELNITEERITETNFARSTHVELSDDDKRGLRLEVGVGVRALRIDVRLRGIAGKVRFRASLESLRRRFEQPPAAAAPRLPQQKPMR